MSWIIEITDMNPAALLAILDSSHAVVIAWLPTYKLFLFEEVFSLQEQMWTESRPASGPAKDSSQA